MPKPKSTSGSTRLTYSNGVVVSVSEDKAARLAAGPAFTAVKAAQSVKSEPSKS